MDDLFHSVLIRVAKMLVARRAETDVAWFIIDDGEHVLLIGSSGAGKTHLAIALGRAACGQGRKVPFFRKSSPVNGTAATVFRPMSGS